VTYHPASLLRNPEQKAQAWEDLCKVSSILAKDQP
jgi:DNA polymerase